MKQTITELTLINITATIRNFNIECMKNWPTLLVAHQSFDLKLLVGCH